MSAASKSKALLHPEGYDPLGRLVPVEQAEKGVKYKAATGEPFTYCKGKEVRPYFRFAEGGGGGPAKPSELHQRGVVGLDDSIRGAQRSGCPYLVTPASPDPDSQDGYSGVFDLADVTEMWSDQPLPGYRVRLDWWGMGVDGQPRYAVEFVVDHAPEMDSLYVYSRLQMVVIVVTAWPELPVEQVLAAVANGLANGLLTVEVIDYRDVDNGVWTPPGCGEPHPPHGTLHAAGQHAIFGLLGDAIWPFVSWPFRDIALLPGFGRMDAMMKFGPRANWVQLLQVAPIDGAGLAELLDRLRDADAVDPNVWLAGPANTEENRLWLLDHQGRSLQIEYLGHAPGPDNRVHLRIVYARRLAGPDVPACPGSQVIEGREERAVTVTVGSPLDAIVFDRKRVGAVRAALIEDWLAWVKRAYRADQQSPPLPVFVRALGGTRRLERELRRP